MAANASSLNSTNVRHVLRGLWLRTTLGIASAVAPAAAAQRAARLFATPPRHPHTARELELLATGERFTVRCGESDLAAWRFGHPARPAVILSHGWGGRGAQLGAFVPALLAAGYQPVAFDHAGHGYSEGRDSSVVHFVRGIEAVVAAVEGAAPVRALVGHSLGAAAVGAWLDATRREARAVLVAPPVSVERHLAHFARRLGLSEPVRRAVRAHFEARLGTPWDRFELPGSVARVRAAALVIHDRDDREVAFASGLALARAWRGARLVATRGLGHRRILRDPAVAQDAADFIDGRVVFAPPPATGERHAFSAPAPLF